MKDSDNDIYEENKRLRELLRIYGGCRVCEHYNHDTISCNKGGHCDYKYFSVKVGN